MRHFLATKVLLYSIGRAPSEAGKRQRALELLDQDDGALSVQALQAAQPLSPSDPASASADRPSRLGRLLGLVRKLIDYGKELAGTVRRRACTDPHFARCAFGTGDLALIFARCGGN
jgi:hypothetical protein